MLTIHHLNDSRSQRILWLLEELGLEYEVKYYQRDPESMMAPASLKRIHPLGKSPVVTEGDVVLAESGAIIQYFANKYGCETLKPKPDTPEELRYHYWLHYAEGSAMTPLLIKLIFDMINKAPLPFFVKPVAKGISSKIHRSFIDPQIKLHLDYMESELGKFPWFAGSAFSAADIQMSFPIEVAVGRGGLNNSRPNLMAFLQRIQQRPAYQRALKRGEPR